MKQINSFLLIAGMVLFAACADVDTKSDGTTEISLPGGAKVTHNESGLELPEDFPKNVLHYPNAKLTIVTGSQGGSTVSFESDASIKDVTTFYEKKLSENGWHTKGNFKTAEGAMITAETPESGYVSIAIAMQNKTGRTIINIIRH